MEGRNHNYCKLMKKHCQVCKVSGGKTRCNYWKAKGLSERADNVDNIKTYPRSL